MRVVMKKMMGLAVAGGVAMGVMAGGDAASMALVDKGIESLGGAAKLNAAAGYQVEFEVERNFGGNASTWYSMMVVKGTDHAYTETEGEGQNGPFLIHNVLAGDKGWFRFGDNSNEMQDQQLANQKRTIARQTITTLLTPLKGMRLPLRMRAMLR